jgi:hypothetical protein
MEKKIKNQSNGCRITFRLTEEERRKLEDLLEKSTDRSISSLIRKSLFKGRITIVSYDSSLDRVMEKLSLIHKEIHNIGVNINQATRKLNAVIGQQANLLHAMEITRLYQQTDQKVTELLGIISKLSLKWLPE